MAGNHPTYMLSSTDEMYTPRHPHRATNDRHAACHTEEKWIFTVSMVVVQRLLRAEVPDERGKSKDDGTGHSVREVHKSRGRAAQGRIILL